MTLAQGRQQISQEIEIKQNNNSYNIWAVNEQRLFCYKQADQSQGFMHVIAPPTSTEHNTGSHD